MRAKFNDVGEPYTQDDLDQVTRKHDVFLPIMVWMTSDE